MANNTIFTKTAIDGLIVVEPAVYGDERGFFMESYNEVEFARAGIDLRFVQDNHSKSQKGVLRGLHFQSSYPQGKLVRVVAGSVLDVVVDLRCESPTFGQWYSVVLSAENRRQLYMPPSFAHGFLALEDDTQLLYKCTEYYHPEHESGIKWDDPVLAVDWQLNTYNINRSSIIVSNKDALLPSMSQVESEIIHIS